MSAQFSFLEYTYNSKRTPPDTFRVMIEKLGYTKVAANLAKTHEVWNHNHNVWFTTHNREIVSPGITGIGFVCSPRVVLQMGGVVDDNTDMFIVHDPNGMKVMLCAVDENGKDALLSKKYIKRNDVPPADPMLLKYTSGVVYHGFSDEVAEFYTRLGFRITSNSNEYASMVCASNRFTIMFKKDTPVVKIQAVICETDDVFYTTSYCVKQRLNLKPYSETAENFGPLTYKINGYDCLAAGTADSYTIENCIIQALPNVDLIFRSRKQYIHVDEDTLTKHIS